MPGNTKKGKKHRKDTLTDDRGSAPVNSRQITYIGVAAMQKTQNLQDAFLNQVRRDKTSLTVFLMNGFQIHGIIRAFDGFTVILDSDGKQQLIYKHAISTIIPPRPVEYSAEDA